MDGLRTLTLLALFFETQTLTALKEWIQGRHVYWKGKLYVVLKWCKQRISIIEEGAENETGGKRKRGPRKGSHNVEPRDLRIISTLDLGRRVEFPQMCRKDVTEASMELSNGGGHPAHLMHINDMPIQTSKKRRTMTKKKNEEESATFGGAHPQSTFICNAHACLHNCSACGIPFSEDVHHAALNNNRLICSSCASMVGGYIVTSPQQRFLAELRQEDVASASATQTTTTPIPPNVFGTLDDLEMADFFNTA